MIKNLYEKDRAKRPTKKSLSHRQRGQPQPIASQREGLVEVVTIGKTWAQKDKAKMKKLANFAAHTALSWALEVCTGSMGLVESELGVASQKGNRKRRRVARRAKDEEENEYLFLGGPEEPGE